MKRIQLVPFSKMEEMRKYFYEYLVELSEFDPDIKFDEKGVPIYKWYDCYWTDKKRYPFYFIVDGKIAGLAMIRELDNMVYDFAEFYVCPRFRKDGNAIWFAMQFTELFEGQFVFSTRFTNPRAIRFWGKFAKFFEDNQFFDDEIWRNWTIRKNNFKEHSLNLRAEYFELINNGEKVFEVRLNDEKRKDFNIGDKIVFHNQEREVETIRAIILDKYIFKNFDEMAEKLDKDLLGFKNSSKQEMINTYRSIYLKEKEDQFGVAVFKIKKLND